MISAQRMAETIHPSVLAEMSARRNAMAAQPLPAVDGFARRADIVADAWAENIARQLQAAQHHKAYDESTLRAFATNYARLCSRMASLESRQSFAMHLGVAPPEGGHITREGAAARLDDPMWWRRQLRAIWTRSSEDCLREIGCIRRGHQPYASDAAVEHRAGRIRRTREWMAGRVMANESGEQLELLALADKSLANPALRRGEFMCRMRGFEEIARDLGHVANFWTLTTPSRFHAQHAGGGVNEAWNAADRPRVRDAQAWLRTMWARARAKLARLSVIMYGFRVAEPHHDGTPHWHMVLFSSPASAELIRRVLRGVWLADSGSEPGASEHRAKCITIDPEQGSAAGYVAKYVSKNIDGAGAVGDAVSDETGDSVRAGVARVAAWAAVHGIRQFQQLGGPPVGLWRECRRVREAAGDPDIERARAAADRGDWRAFIYGLSERHIAAGRRVPLKLERPAARLFQTLEAPRNAYGEEIRQPVIGLRYCGSVIITRLHRWRIEKKTPDVALDSRPRSGSDSDLGPVAITVRMDPEALAAADASAWVRLLQLRAEHAPSVAIAEKQRPPPAWPPDCEFSTPDNNQSRFGRHIKAKPKEKLWQ